MYDQLRVIIKLLISEIITFLIMFMGTESISRVCIIFQVCNQCTQRVLVPNPYKQCSCMGKVHSHLTKKVIIISILSCYIIYMYSWLSMVSNREFNFLLNLS